MRGALPLPLILVLAACRSPGADHVDASTLATSSSATTVPSTAPTAAVDAAPPVAAPLTPAQRASALAGVAQFQAVMHRRIARGREKDEVCEAKTNAESPLMRAASEQVGTDRMHEKTRFASKAPYLGWDVETTVWACMGCTGFGPEDDEAVPHECTIALTSLADLADELKAGK